MTAPVAVDFETDPIQKRPAYPPRPASVAIWEPGRKPEFWAWGHPTENNCTKAEAGRRLKEVWRGKRPLLFHNAMFDLDVAETFFQLALPSWDRWHDTMFQLFLADPNAEGLRLKDACELYLDWPKEDQKPLEDWLVKNVKEATRSNWEAHMAKLPGRLAASRGVGDVRRTRALHDAFYTPSEAYDRERRLLPTLLGMERRGVPVNLPALEKIATEGGETLERTDRWIAKRVGCPGLKITQRNAFANALEDARLVDEWLITAPSKKHPEGQRKTGYEALREVCADRELVGMVEFRGKIAAQVNTFAKPWVLQAQQAPGKPRVHVQFNQVKSAGQLTSKQRGARTGRLSTSPNLQNVPNYMPAMARTVAGLLRGQKHRSTLLVPLRGANLYDLRSAIVAERGMVLGGHDYSQQELRILAHATPQGALARAYRKDRDTDAHLFVAREVEIRTGRHTTRVEAKGTNFGILFGEGLGLLMEKLQIDDRDDVQKLRMAVRKALGSGDLDRKLKEAQACTTIGGRYCPVEPDSIVGGQLRQWGYKLINTYIQGSAGDQMKEAMILIDEAFPEILVMSIHDELLWEAEKGRAQSLIAPIARLMEEAIPLSVPVIAEGATGRNWRECH